MLFFVGQEFFLVFSKTTEIGKKTNLIYENLTGNVDE